MARSSWILMALVGLVMVGSGMAMLEACPEGQVYVDCKNPCGETPEDNPCAADPVNNYCNVSWCKPEGEEPGMCSFTCTPPPPPMLMRTMVMTAMPESDDTTMAVTTAMPLEGAPVDSTTYPEGELPMTTTVDYLYDEEGNKIRPIAYNYRGGVVPEGTVEGSVEPVLYLEDKVEGGLEGVDPVIYQTGVVKGGDNPLYTPTKVYKGGNKGYTSPKGTKKTKGSKCNQPLARCLVDPCQYTKCGPNTQCVANYCGTCSSSCEPMKGSKGYKVGPSECQAGSYVAKAGRSTTCKKCPAGTYTDEVNDYSKCMSCPEGTYAPRAGAYKCLTCPYGTSSKAGARRCRRDAPQKYTGPKSSGLASGRRG